MSESKHTPGPWEIDGSSIFKEGSNQRIADILHDGRPTETMHADMRLIASAPALLAALDYIVNNCRIFCDDSMDIDGMATEDAMNAVALAKEGRGR
jgi:hypothetical protein